MKKITKITVTLITIAVYAFSFISFLAGYLDPINSNVPYAKFVSLFLAQIREVPIETVVSIICSLLLAIPGTFFSYLILRFIFVKEEDNEEFVETCPNNKRETSIKKLM